jgi:hypothetical protein
MGREGEWEETDATINVAVRASPSPILPLSHSFLDEDSCANRLGCKLDGGHNLVARAFRFFPQ